MPEAYAKAKPGHTPGALERYQLSAEVSERLDELRELSAKAEAGDTEARKELKQNLRSGQKSGETVRMPGHELGHLVVGDSGQLERVDRIGKALNRWVRHCQDLQVAFAGRVHGPESGVEIEERRHHPLLILQPHLRRSDLETGVAVPGRDDVIEDVDFHSGECSKCIPRNSNIFHPAR